MKTSRRHFEVFRREAERAMRVWGVTGWRVDFEVKGLRSSFAQCTWDVDNRIAVIALCSDWGGNARPLTDANLKATARHEVCHLLTAPLMTLATSRYITRDQAEAAGEQVTRAVEYALTKGRK